MRLKANQTRYVAGKIAIDLANADFVKLPKGKEAVVEACKAIIDSNLKQENSLDQKVKEMLEANMDEIEFQSADERQLFFMIKKKMAPEFGVIMDYNDRYNDLAHKILDELYENYLAEYDVNENQIRNIIFKAFRSFADAYESIDDIVYTKIKSMKKELIPGTDDYNIVYERLYEEELIKRGML